MKLVKLTRLDGSDIYFGAGFVVEAAPRTAEGAQAAVAYGGERRYVKETVDEVVVAISRAGFLS